MKPLIITQARRSTRPRADGTPTIAEILGDIDDDTDPREDKPWPADEDCAGCPGHRDGPHKLSCSIGGARQVRLCVSLVREDKEP